MCSPSLILSISFADSFSPAKKKSTAVLSKLPHEDTQLKRGGSKCIQDFVHSN
jgi:hypothetical protein